jgi:hypothetical protein
MTNVKQTMDESQPFSASLVDRLNNWVKQLPVPAGIFFALLGLVLISVQVLFFWLEGDSQDLTILLPVLVFNGLFIPYPLGLIYLLDHQAVQALEATRPTLDINEVNLEQYAYRLANMPGRSALVAGLGLVLFTVLTEQVGMVPRSYALLDQLPYFNVLFQIIDKGSAFFFGVLIYHTIRQLRLINTINLQYTRINLFNLSPLQAFSRVTSTTAVGLVFGVYGWILINPELLVDPITIGFVVIISLLAVAVFVWPLYGVHRRMETEKEKMLNDLDLHFEAAFAEFNQGLRNRDDAAIERQNGVIASLETQHNRIKAIPTWPWKPETVQFVITAITLPMILAILQVIIEQAFG